MNTVIRADRVSKVFNIYKNSKDRLKNLFNKNSKTQQFWALSNISFEIKQGESVGLIGRNGSGKSTLLQLIASILKPTSGSIEVIGKVAALLELGSGFNPEFTGKENIFFNATLLGLSKKEIKRKYDSIVEFADIGEFIDQPVKTYSSGMMIRLAFSVMIHISPDILIIDEALAVGDIFFQQKCVRFLKENFADKTKIFVAHDMKIISSLCQRVIFLDKGVIQFDGDVGAGIESYVKNSHQVAPLKYELPSLEPVKGWAMIAEEKLSGLMEIKILGIKVFINNQQIEAGGAPIRCGDKVEMKVLFLSTKPLLTAIFGYLVADKLGNYVFGHNKFHNHQFYDLEAAGHYIGHYSFIWPDVHQGQYTLTPGVGEGKEPVSHLIQCWAHNVFVFECISAHPVHGLFNNPLTYFDIEHQTIKTLENSNDENVECEME